MSATHLVQVKILSNEEASSGFYILRVDSPEISSIALPGQFAHIRCGEGKAIILRRPLSFHKIKGREISFIYQVLGRGTEVLKTRKTGESLSLLGPLGRGFWFEKNSNKKILVAGGMGIAPFPFLIQKMAEGGIDLKSIFVIYGAKKRDMLVGIDELHSAGVSLNIATDDGSEGFKGTAAELLSDLIKNGTIKDGDFFTCGPEKMMENVVKVAKSRKRRVQVSLEEKMACGAGVCLSCVRKIKGEYLRVCKEGPVFWGDEVEW